MANVESNRTIRARIKKDETVINAKIIDADNIIRSNVQSFSAATTEKSGIIRIATLEEAQEGEDNSIAITPYTLKELTTTYIHEQGVASDTWIIHHNLNKHPSITIVDSAENVVEGAEKYIDNNTIEIYFNGAFKGKAYLN